MAGVPGAGGPRVAAIVLGASNVSRGLARLAAVVRARAAGPVDLFVAAGHGRSYGVNSRVWARRLPSVLRCGLWRALDREGVGTGQQRPVSLITDVGNDLLYGSSPALVAAWVAEAVSRLRGRGATIAITRLPTEAIARVGPFRYRMLKAMLVPGCPLSLAEVHAAATELDDRLADLATSEGLALLEQPGHWYGIDALHPRRRRLDTLWHAACDAWGMASAPRRRASYGEWASLGRSAAEVRSLARVPRFTPQPVHRFPDGGTVSLY